MTRLNAGRSLRHVRDTKGQDERAHDQCSRKSIHAVLPPPSSRYMTDRDRRLVSVRPEIPSPDAKSLRKTTRQYGATLPQRRKKVNSLEMQQPPPNGGGCQGGQ